MMALLRILISCVHSFVLLEAYTLSRYCPIELHYRESECVNHNANRMALGSPVNVSSIRECANACYESKDCKEAMFDDNECYLFNVSTFEAFPDDVTEATMCSDDEEQHESVHSECTLLTCIQCRVPYHRQLCTMSVLFQAHELEESYFHDEPPEKLATVRATTSKECAEQCWQRRYSAEWWNRTCGNADFEPTNGTCTLFKDGFNCVHVQESKTQFYSIFQHTSYDTVHIGCIRCSY